MWVIIKGSSELNNLAKIRPNGSVTEYSPDDLVNPEGIAAGPDGNLWATRNGGVVKIPPGNPDAAVATDIDAIGGPQRIIRGPGGKMWTASGDKLISFLPSDPAGFGERTIPDMGARGIATSGGKLWIADFTGVRIVRVTPGGGVKFFKVGDPDEMGPQAVARGPRKGVGYTNQGSDPDTVGRIFKGTNARRTKVPNTDPFGITFAADGRWWVANFLSHNLTILDRQGNARRFRNLPDNSGPRYIAAGPNNTVWVGLETAEKVARIKGVTR